MRYEGGKLSYRVMLYELDLCPFRVWPASTPVGDEEGSSFL